MTLEERVDILEAELKHANKKIQKLSELFLFGSIKTEKDFIMVNGTAVDKTEAAKILGVTRATIYAMIKDGRLTTMCEGTRISVSSIYKYMYGAGVLE